MLQAQRGPRPFEGANYWPGFVDAMATLLLVIIFLLSVFMLGQFYLSQAVSGRDEALLRLQARITELGELLALEKSDNENLRLRIQELQTTLQETQIQNETQEEDPERIRMRDEIGLLNRQLDSLRQQLQALQAALEIAEEKDRQARIEIVNLSKRLNAALARRVEELKRVRSRFFEGLSEALGERGDIVAAGDRFVLPAEVLFDLGSAKLSAGGQREVAKLAQVILEITPLIPADIDWILRVDGHTDILPIATAEFPSNWHLSAARAIAVVEALAERGIAEKRLLAAGFGEFRPLVEGESEASLRQNRRIEFKLTERSER